MKLFRALTPRSETEKPRLLVNGPKEGQKVWCQQAKVLHGAARSKKIYVLWMKYFPPCLNPLNGHQISQLAAKMMGLVMGEDVQYEVEK